LNFSLTSAKGAGIMSKKDNIIKAATHLFANQGFDGTTTKQISVEASITEPLIYYHFTGKDEIYTSILASVYDEYFSRLKTLPGKTDTQFEKIENLCKLQFQLINKMPDEMVLIVSQKPGKLVDPENVYSKYSQSKNRRLKSYLSNCLKKGIHSGEFAKVSINETASVLLIMIDGILRLAPGRKNKLLDSTVELLKRSLAA